jgi:hypothetical protein
LQRHPTVDVPHFLDLYRLHVSSKWIQLVCKRALTIQHGDK